MPHVQDGLGDWVPFTALTSGLLKNKTGEPVPVTARQLKAMDETAREILTTESFLRCKGCRRTFKDQETLAKHRTSCFAGCPVCGKTFVSSLEPAPSCVSSPSRLPRPRSSRPPPRFSHTLTPTPIPPQADDLQADLHSRLCLATSARRAAAAPPPPWNDSNKLKIRGYSTARKVKSPVRTGRPSPAVSGTAPRYVDALPLHYCTLLLHARPVVA